MISAIRGTQDKLSLVLEHYVRDTLAAHLTRYGFHAVETPILEPVELFRRSLGLHTDVVSKEMYLVHTDHASSESICLRPESTASLMRAFLNNHIQETPWRAYTYGPMFRHERPQKGRYRQFTQLSMEIINAPSLTHDVELITMLDRYFVTQLRMTNYVLHVNFLGTREDRARYKEVLRAYLKAQPSLPEKIVHLMDTNILRVFDLKDAACQQVLTDAPVLTDYLSDDSRARWEQVKRMLACLSVSYVHNPRLVRGLDYYCDTVFEFIGLDLGAQNTFCGGGRYNELSRELGHKETIPAIGAAIGIERLALLLEPMRERLALPQAPALHTIIPFSDEEQTLALMIADVLRHHGLCVEVITDATSLKSALRKADKAGAATALILGEDERKGNYVTVKFLRTHAEERIRQDQLVERLTQMR